MTAVGNLNLHKGVIITGNGNYMSKDKIFFLLKKKMVLDWWLTPVIPSLSEADAGRSIEARSLRPAWPPW